MRRGEKGKEGDEGEGKGGNVKLLCASPTSDRGCTTAS